MNTDVLIKRGYPLVVAALIATAAYFQARGLSSLLSATLAVDTDAAPPRSHVAAARATLDEHATSAAPVVARNPFDSVTGPLDARPDQGAPMTDVEASAPTDPYEDPPCDAAQVVIIAEADDPAWSFAMITASGEHARMRREGDEIAGHTVDAIVWDRVWLTSGEARCQLRLGTRTAPKAKPPVAPPKPAGKPGKGKVPPEIASRIQKVSEREYNVDRSAIDLIIEQQATLLATTRLLPAKEGGKVVGYRLPRVAADSLFGMLGIKSGDQIQSINGFELTDPQSALQAYARLRTADRLTVALRRGGKDTSVDVNIR